VPIIELESVSKRYATGTRALSEVSLSIDEGEFVFIVGATGTGKSTLLRLLYAEEAPTEGTVRVFGRPVDAKHPAAVSALRRSLGVVFQDFKLLPNRTVYENVAFAPRVIGAPPAWIPAQVRHALEQVGLSDCEHARPHELSGGQQQRVSIARAIVNRPRILLADEPTGNLDPETSWDVMKVLSRINLQGTTLVMTTHNKTIVDVLRRRVIELADGQIVRDESRGRYATSVN
jgi:cell division transport system ATP-binding protein